MANQKTKYSSLANNLRALRIHMKYTQNDAANIFGVSKNAYAQWEIDGGSPSSEALVKGSNALGISIDELMKTDFTQLYDHKNIDFHNEINAKLFASILNCAKK